MSNIPAELMQQFLRVDKRYSINPNEEPFFDMPTSLNLEKLVYEQPTAEEISAAAEAKLLIDYNKSKNKINEAYTKTMDKIAVRKTAAQNDTLVAKQKVDDELAKTKAEISAEMLSRGLARSSVFAEAVSKAESDAQSAKDELDWRLELTIDGLEDEEADALAVKTAAIASLDDVYEDELAQEIAEMTQKAQDEANDVAKYNNSVEQDEANYKKSWTTSYIQAQQSHAETAMKLQGIAIDQGYDVIQQYIYQDKATFTKDYYLGIDAQQAYSDFVAAQTEFTQQLSAAYYNEVKQFLYDRTQ